LDNGRSTRETLSMPSPGGLRQRIAATLNVAYGDGLLSDHTLAHRLELLFESPVIEPSRLIGDLTLRSRDASLSGAIDRTLRCIRGWLRDGRDPAPSVLALDWSGATDELLLGRASGCDIVLSDPTVSRRHARLRFRDGHWVLQDLRSTNGTSLNDTAVVRCQLRPGDRLRVGDQQLLVD
jgi:FHA domain